MKKILPLLILIFACFGFSAKTNASFVDVSPSHPYYEAIQNLERRGVIEGYSDGTYQPDKEISRAEALKIILEGSGILVSENASKALFPDVDPTTWYAKYVSEAKNLGIVKGDDNTGLFRPGDNVVLAEQLKILLETNKRKVFTPDKSPYLDVPVDVWFAPYFAYAKMLALFPQSGGENIQPAQAVTRGLMADLMYQLMLKPEGYQEGEASYYGFNLHGNGTASGEKFDAYSLTAAHPTLPFGTMVKVKNLNNGKEVIVKINDRGPYADDRIIDLSQAAFEAIAPLSQGVAHVAIVPTDAVNQNLSGLNCEKGNFEMFAENSFEYIALDKKFPNQYLSNEVWHFSGKATGINEKGVTAFLVSEDGKQYHFYSEINPENRFDLNLFFPQPGKYQLGIVLGESGTSVIKDIQVLDSKCQTALDVSSNDMTIPSEVQFKLKEGHLEVNWNQHDADKLSKLTFKQGNKEKEYIVYNKGNFTPYYADFLGWEEGEVSLEIQAGYMEKESMLSAEQIKWSPAFKTNLQVLTHQNYLFNEDEARLLALPESLSANQALAIKIDPFVNINEKGLIILPTGKVDSAILSSTQNAIVNDYGTRVFPNNAVLQLAFTPQSNEVHVFEINNEEGQAVVNVPIYPINTYPLLPNPVDLSTFEDVNLEVNLNLLRSQMLTLLNQDRQANQLSSLKLDNNLNQLAQMKADDMVNRGYLSHWDSQGLTVNQLRQDFDIKQFVSENIAKDKTPILAQYSLMSSASHRMNMLNEEWKRVGFGITKDPSGGYIFVQIFSDDPVDLSNLDPLRDKVLTAINTGRTTGLELNVTLNNVSQAWSETMVKEDFFSLTSPENKKLIDEIRNEDILEALGTYLVGNTSFEAAINQIAKNEAIKDSRWKKIGIGLAQDETGVIKITLSYTE